jgi:LPS export ABC transporter protein LptC
MSNFFSAYQKIFLVAAFITGCFFIMSCENDEKKIQALTEKRVMKEEAKEVECYLSQQGEMKATLKAPTMLRVMGDTLYTEFPKTLHVDFYNDSVQIESWLDAKYGKYFEQLNKVYLRDSVVVINTAGDTLLTPDLWWDQNTKLLYTDKVAQFHTKDKHISGGKGMEATQDLRSVIFKEPTGTIQVSENGFQNAASQ